MCKSRRTSTRLRAEARRVTYAVDKVDKMNDKLQLFNDFSWLVATCICSESASKVLELSKCFICSQLHLPKASHAGAMLI